MKTLITKLRAPRLRMFRTTGIRGGVNVTQLCTCDKCGAHVDLKISGLYVCSSCGARGHHEFCPNLRKIPITTPNAADMVHLAYVGTVLTKDKLKYLRDVFGVDVDQSLSEYQRILKEDGQIELGLCGRVTASRLVRFAERDGVEIKEIA